MSLSFSFLRNIVVGLIIAVVAFGAPSVASAAPASAALAGFQTSNSKSLVSSGGQKLKQIHSAEFQAKKKKKKRKATIANPDTLPQPQVAVIPGSVINLLSRSSKIPIAIKNGYGSPVRIRVIVQPSNLRVLIPAVVEVLVPANTTVTAQVPVTAIGDGDVVLHTTLESFSGMHLTAPVDIQMKVILGVEDAVLYGFFGFVALLGTIGVVRTIRKNRRNLAKSQNSIGLDLADEINP